jgi:inosose dehydratase
MFTLGGKLVPSKHSRREFLAAAGTLTALSATSIGAIAKVESFCSSAANSSSGKAVTSASAEIRFGYAAITWGGNDRQAIEDIASAGYRGIQLRSNVIAEFENKPETLWQFLEAHHLPMVALSSGNVDIDADPDSVIGKHAMNAKFVHDAGGPYLQVTDAKPKSRPITPDDYKKLGRLLTEIGKRTADLGVALGYHNHMGSLGQGPEAVDQIIGAADPRYVGLELDIAHYFQGGGDPVKAIDRYRERLLFLHIKDVEKLDSKKSESKESYRFVELGRGQVDIKGVLAALTRIGFRGWAIVELDQVPDPSRTPKESALISKKFLQENLGYTI